MMGGASRFILLLTTPFSLLHPRSSPSLFRLARHSPLSLAPLSTAPHHHLTLSRPPSLLPIKASQHIHTQTNSVNEDHFGDSLSFSPNPRPSHPWPEWSQLVHTLSAGGYFDRAASEGHGIGLEDAFVAYEDFPEEFVRVASACLAYARELSDILGSLSRRNIEVIVENGTPFLFKSALDISRRMRSFLGTGRTNVLESDKAHTIDLMKYLLSYASKPIVSSERNNMYSRELIESSVRNLLRELAEVSCRVPVSDLSAPEQYQVSGRYGPTLRPLGQNIEMKRGDWICPKCSFMNFARNVKCLECEEPRPKRQLTGGEWECPQCDFFNYGRNMVCLRCDCKRPGEASFGTVNSRPGLGYNNGGYANKAEIDSRLVVNEEKAQRWFNKVSQQNNASDMNSASTDEDFPEIMPLRKGVNRFVVSTRKTPLERRLANSQYQRNLDNDGTPEGGSDSQKEVAKKTLDTSISRSLDQILGHASSVSGTDPNSIASGHNAGPVNSTPLPRSGSSQYGLPKGSNSSYVPFVPLPADMFAKKPQNSKMEDSEVVTENIKSGSSEPLDQIGPVSVSGESGKSGESIQLSEKPATQAESQDKEREQAEKSERWFKRVAELHDVTDLASAISDEDFPEIMPMRKGENRFVVSKKKDRSLTSPMYKRQMAMEQASNTKFVPFVPFPPDYFAKKNKQQPDSTDSIIKPTDESSSISMTQEKFPQTSDDAGLGAVDMNHVQRTENQQTDTRNWSSNISVEFEAPSSGNPTQNSFSSQTISNDSWSSRYSVKQNTSQTGPPSSVKPTQNSFSSQTISDDSWSSTNLGKENTSQTGAPSRGNTTRNTFSSQTIYNERWSNRDSVKERENTSQTTNLAGSPPQLPENQNVKSGWTGKSLEGSAVKEPDPLDMSEEAKAERWFRRVAQIKDISELSQIPDEDFPSIMPMRKGVNRFVVSKRKTPLERRLTSSQYRRNLPIVSSDPVKKENDGS